MGVFADVNMDLAETHPTSAWLLEKVFGSLLIFCFCWAISGCWRSARANQKLALGDAYDHIAGGRREERKSLLLPMSSSGRGGSGGGRMYY